MPHGYKKENLDFNNILKQWGVNDLSQLIGCSSSEDEATKKKKRNQANAKLPASLLAKPPGEKSAQPDKQLQNRFGLIEGIMNENRAAHSKQKELDGMPQSIHDMLDALGGADALIGAGAAAEKSGEDSDVAPMSALVDTPSREELKH